MSYRDAFVNSRGADKPCDSIFRRHWQLLKEARNASTGLSMSGL